MFIFFFLLLLPLFFILFFDKFSYNFIHNANI